MRMSLKFYATGNKKKKTTTGQGQSKIPWIFFYPIVHYISGALWDGHNVV